jgi:hypothetical protein
LLTQKEKSYCCPAVVAMLWLYTQALLDGLEMNPNDPDRADPEFTWSIHVPMAVRVQPVRSPVSNPPFVTSWACAGAEEMAMAAASPTM